jgi:lipid A disaccharide synthetase
MRLDPPLKILIAAGEVSSDRQAGYLARELLLQRTGLG